MEEYSSPGAMLKGEIRKKRLTQKQFAAAVSMSPSLVSELVSNKRAMSKAVVAKLQSFFHIPAKEWLDLQTMYQLIDCIAKEEAENAEELREMDEYVAIDTLLDRVGGLTVFNIDKKKEILRQEFGFENILQLNKISWLYIGYEIRGIDMRMFNAWLLLARREARLCKVEGSFDKADMEAVLKELYNVFHCNIDTLRCTREILGRYGIRFCQVRALELAPVAGLFFCESGIPAIVLPTSLDKIESFAFRVMHGLCHVYKHLLGANDQRFDIEGQVDDDEIEEMEANEFALNALIPNELWNTSPVMQPVASAIQEVVIPWAQSNGLNARIVLDRITRELSRCKSQMDSPGRVQ